MAERRRSYALPEVDRIFQVYAAVYEGIPELVMLAGKTPWQGFVIRLVLN